ncbi:MAG: thioredoxin-disulfide reductase [Spirochaetaceae bacterium]|nr:thioredoxin-disulfide reductase [Spirochaetaceae bacterium]MCF7947217.1 thioredoxin-disulfide reductase [Spirochaetia bacterium]MCF7950256.1 thioredoxin-disulfide reductase [Spirochaetaceae bacterium]
MQTEKLIVIGSGPAGLAAALYTGRAGLNPLVLSGLEMGGQISLTYDVDNYLGFPEGTTGPDLIELMTKHVGKFGARLQFEEVTQVDLKSGPPFQVSTHAQQYQAEAVVVATGASPRRLQVPGEEKYIGHGISFCATCDGFFFRDKDVLVIGGGDSAIEESLFLTKFAKRVRVVHRRDQLRAGEQLKRAAYEHDKIEFVWDTVIEEVLGEDKVTGAKVKNVKTGAVSELETDGIFIFIGHYPNSKLFQGQLDMDSEGYITTDKRMMTNIPGVFAAGEIQDKLYRQIATSVGQGSGAGIMADRWLHRM